MFRPVFLFISLRYLFSRKKDNFARFISILSIFGILLGSMGLVIVLSIMNGLERQMAEHTLRYLPQVEITNAAQRLTQNAKTRAELSALFPKNPASPFPALVPLIKTEAMIQSNDGLSLVQLIGLDPNELDPIANTLLAPLSELLPENEYHVLIGLNLAQQLNVNEGDFVRLFVPEVTVFTPLGRLPSQRLFKISAIFSANPETNQSQIYVNIKDAAQLLKWQPNDISSWRLIVDQPLALDRIKSAPLPEGFLYQDWRSQKGTLFNAIKMEKNIMGLLISLIVIVAASNVLTSLALLIMEKRSEIAILKTIGLRFRGILLIFLLQGLLIALVGSAIGIGAGLLILHYLEAILSILEIPLQLPILIDGQQMVYLVLFLFFMALISTFYPAYQAAKTHPVEALKDE